ncbi:hypothetical protein KAR91_01220 [Candidatus Pacearchaeota archaeon]|nr:hypothetical protein [Candidatus Pacearchaeota archaeon]
MEYYLASSFVILMFVALFSFIISFHKARWTLAILAPILLCAGVMGFNSYKALLGYPVSLEWEQLPERWTVIFFRVEDKTTISLWLLQNNTTRLVKLPYVEQAKEVLEGEKPTMGRGVPVTFGKKGEGDENSEGNPGEESTDPNEQKDGGWNYKVQSYGDPIEGKLPGKQ